MKLLIDTQLLIWAAAGTLSKKAESYFEDDDNELYFSPVSIWEITIKNSLNRKDFSIDAELFYKGLIENGYLELPLTSLHTLSLDSLPKIHKDPFDRILISQATAEGLRLLSSDKIISKYPGDIIFV
ncbi:MAG: type II toxin-antitoxin system VapC family toxin [Clostridiales Family XIII bacterium]|jgi:PIN domain nuclease of toxin-antitoxin system|nr:type II toxin-antitoxin system VapC family toxin [Clostridiales Family XIII bacterium]